MLMQRPGAPQVTFATLSGETLRTSDLRGKVLLVNFWATSCAVCLEEMPGMVRTYRKFAPRGYEMIAVAMSHDHPNQVADFVQQRALPFKVALDGNGEVAKSFGNVRVTPTTFLNVANSLGSDHVVVRPDTAFQLLREANGLPWW